MFVQGEICAVNIYYLPDMLFSAIPIRYPVRIIYVVLCIKTKERLLYNILICE